MTDQTITATPKPKPAKSKPAKNTEPIPESFWVQNVSGSVLKLTDLRIDRESPCMVFHPGEAFDLFDAFPVNRVKYSQSLRSAIRIGWLQILPGPPEKRLGRTSIEKIRERLNEVKEEKVSHRIEDGKLVMDFPGGIDPQLVQAVTALVSGKPSEYDLKFTKFEEDEWAENLRRAGRIKVNNSGQNFVMPEQFRDDS